MGIITENKTGADCSGSTGGTNRILTLSNVALTQANGFQVFKNGTLLTLTTNYTVSHNDSASTVTFIDALLDAAVLVVQYIQGSTTATAYCNYTDIYNKTGLSTTEVSSAIVDLLIDDATSEINALTGRLFTNANSRTQYLNYQREDILDNKSTTIVLSNFPLQSITSMLELDVDGNTVYTFGTLTSTQIGNGTYYTTDYWLDVMEEPLEGAIVPTGKIILKTRSIPEGTHKIKVAYTYGYSSVPNIVKNLATCLTGIRCWLRFAGGCYNRLNSYSIPQQSIDKGDFYQRAQQNITMLTEEAERLLERIGRKPRMLFYASGGNR